MSRFDVSDLTLPAPGLPALRAAARQEGFRFIDRLVSDWQSGDNRFTDPGERFVGATAGTKLVAVGGLNRDPYADSDRIGRLRHVYVMPARRRIGIGGAVLAALLSDAAAAFDEIRVRTDTGYGSAFYRAAGFSATPGTHHTHALALERTPILRRP